MRRAGAVGEEASHFPADTGTPRDLRPSAPGTRVVGGWEPAGALLAGGDSRCRVDRGPAGGKRRPMVVTNQRKVARGWGRGLSGGPWPGRWGRSPGGGDVAAEGCAWVG